MTDSAAVTPTPESVSRRSAFLVALAAALGSTAALAAMTTEAEAKRGGFGRGGRGRGWAMGRGRKRGWYKRGGPRWWRG